MSAQEQAVFTPEVEALLREAAADPKSILLRAPRRGTRAWSNEPVRPTATGLSSLERHLLRAHRAEMGALLREWTRARLAAVRSPMRITLPGSSASVRSTAVDRDARAGTAGDIARSVEWCEMAKSLTPHERFDRQIEHLSIEQLAELASRFDPSTSSILHAGLGAFARSDHALALERFASVVRTAASAIHLSAAWSNLGLVWLNTRRIRAAQTAYRRACALWPENAAAALSDCFISIQLGDTAHLHVVARDLDTLVLALERADLDECVAELVLGRAMGRWTPTPEATCSIGRLTDSPATVIRRMLDAFR